MTVAREIEERRQLRFVRFELVVVVDITSRSTQPDLFVFYLKLNRRLFDLVGRG